MGTSFNSLNFFVTLSFLSVWIVIALHYRLGQNVLPKVQSFPPQKKEKFLLDILTKADIDTCSHFVCLYFISVQQLLRYYPYQYGRCN